MMPDTKKILYTTDLSKNAIYAFQYAVYLSQKLGSEIIILHVIEKMSADAQLMLMAYIDKKERRRLSEERVEHTVEQIKNRLKIFSQKVLKDQKANLDKIVAIEVCEGYPEEQILEKAKEFDCDAIIMGAHEKGISNTFLGSVAKRVLRRSRTPVIIVPLPKGETTLSFHE
jgi:nucleotide-binding universal stress UspA family protein